MAAVPIELEHVIGFVGTVSSPVVPLHTNYMKEPTKLFYASGNVGVIHDVQQGSQQLLRGHKNPIRASTTTKDNGLIITACAGSESCLIVWSANGSALAAVDEPHSYGTLAMDVSHDNKFLATLSVPYPISHSAGGSSSGSGSSSPKGKKGAAASSSESGHKYQQTLSVWRLPEALHRSNSTLSGTLSIANGSKSTSLGLPALDLVNTMTVPAPAADLHHTVVFNQATDISPLPGTTAEEATEQRKQEAAVRNGTAGAAGAAAAAAAAALNRAYTGLLYELATTGQGSVAFYCLYARLAAKKLGLTSLPGADALLGGSAAAGGAEGGGAAGPTGHQPLLSRHSIDGFVLTGQGQRLTGTTPCAPLSDMQASMLGILGATPAPGGGLLSAKRKDLTAGAAGTWPFATGDAAGGAGSPQHGGAGGGGGHNPSAALSTLAPVRKKTATVTCFIPLVMSGHSAVTAMTAVDDGTLVMWATPAPLLHGTTSLATAAQEQLQEKEAATVLRIPDHRLKKGVVCSIAKAEAKTVKLTRAEVKSLVKGAPGSSAGTREGEEEEANPHKDHADRVNVLTLSPCGRFIVVGGEDGGVRCYDLHMRLAAWFEELQAGGISCISFLRNTGYMRSAEAVAAAAADAGDLHHGAVAGRSGSDEGAPGSARLNSAAAQRRRSILAEHAAGMMADSSGKAMRAYLRREGSRSSGGAGAGEEEGEDAEEGFGEGGHHDSEEARRRQEEQQLAAEEEAAHRAHMEAMASATVPQSRAGLSDFLVSTRKSLLLMVRAAGFESLDAELRKGSILLEGPDSAVVGIAAYPDAPRVAIAIASGSIQVWSTDKQKQLLVVRELPRTDSGKHGLQLGQKQQGFFHPTCIAIDSKTRFLAVGTAEGMVLLVDPHDLRDIQAPIGIPMQKAKLEAAEAAALQGGGGSVTDGVQAGGSQVSDGSGGMRVGQGGSVTDSLLALQQAPPAAPITRILLSADGFHLATTDAQNHVNLFRYARTRIKQISAAGASKLGLVGSASGPGGAPSALPRSMRGLSPRKTVHPGGRITSNMPGKPRAWEIIDGDEQGTEEFITDTWVLVGRCKSHNDSITGLAFSPLGPGQAACERIWVKSRTPGDKSYTGTYSKSAAARPAGFEGESFWSPPQSFTQRLPIADIVRRHRTAGLGMLCSVGQDRRLVLYDVGASSIPSGLVVAGDVRAKIEHFALPTACAWHPLDAPLPDTESVEAELAESVLVANSHCKLKLWRYLGATPTVPGAAAGVAGAAGAAGAAAGGGLGALSKLRAGVLGGGASGMAAGSGLAAVQQRSAAAGGGMTISMGSKVEEPVCRKTTLQPAFGGQLTQLLPVRGDFSTPATAASSVPSSAAGWSIAAGSAGGASSVLGGGRPSSAGGRPGSAGGSAGAAAVGLEGFGGAATAGKGSDSSCPALAFATDDSVLGLMLLPLSGNPHSMAGVIAHSGPVTALAVGYDGHGMFSSGLDTPLVNNIAASGLRVEPLGGSVSFWKLGVQTLQTDCSAAGVGVEPFQRLLMEEDGSATESGSVYQDVCDFFSYAQIRSQGEASTAARSAGNTLPLSQLPFLMRGLGFYPTLAEVSALVAEARAIRAARREPGAAGGRGGAGGVAGSPPGSPSRAATARAQTPGMASGSAAMTAPAEQVPVDLDTCVMLYANHRPVTPYSSSDLMSALSLLTEQLQDPDMKLARTRNAEVLYGGRPIEEEEGPPKLRWGNFLQALQSRGERLTASEFKDCMVALLGPEAEEGIPYEEDQDVGAEEIAGKILGFDVPGLAAAGGEY